MNTFKRSTAQRVPSECSQPRYTCDILEYLFKSTAERVSSECSQARYIADIFQKYIFIAGSDILPIYCPSISDVAPCCHKWIRYVLYITQWGGVEFKMNIAPVYTTTCHPEVEELPGGALHAVKSRLRINKTSRHVICAEVG